MYSGLKPLLMPLFLRTALVFAGTGAVVVNDVNNGDVSHVGIGLVIMVMIYAVGDVSGAHFNPTVSIGFWLARRFPGREVLPSRPWEYSGLVVLRDHRGGAVASDPDQKND